MYRCIVCLDPLEYEGYDVSYRHLFDTTENCLLWRVYSHKIYNNFIMPIFLCQSTFQDIPINFLYKKCRMYRYDYCLKDHRCQAPLDVFSV
jgi:hypothetical protein